MQKFFASSIIITFFNPFDKIKGPILSGTDNNISWRTTVPKFKNIYLGTNDWLAG